MKIHQGKSTGLSVFVSRVLAAVKRIPKGRITTYGILAGAIGRPKAIRAAANALKRNPCLIKIPCHRVIRSDGKIGGYRLGTRKKLSLLKKEGIGFNENKIKNLRKILYEF